MHEIRDSLPSLDPAIITRRIALAHQRAQHVDRITVPHALGDTARRQIAQAVM